MMSASELNRDQLSDGERQALAREVAADKYGYRDDDWSKSRTIFHQGWDAAMEYAVKKATEGVEHLD